MLFLNENKYNYHITKVSNTPVKINIEVDDTDEKVKKYYVDKHINIQNKPDNKLCFASRICSDETAIILNFVAENKYICEIKGVSNNSIEFTFKSDEKVSELFDNLFANQRELFDKIIMNK